MLLTMVPMLGTDELVELSGDGVVPTQACPPRQALDSPDHIPPVLEEARVRNDNRRQPVSNCKRTQRVIEPKQHCLARQHAVTGGKRPGNFPRVSYNHNRANRQSRGHGFFAPESTKFTKPWVFDRPEWMVGAVVTYVFSNQTRGFNRGFRLDPVLWHRHQVVPSTPGLREQSLVRLHRERIFPMSAFIAGTAFDQPISNVRAAQLQCACEYRGAASVHSEHQHSR